MNEESGGPEKEERVFPGAFIAFAAVGVLGALALGVMLFT